jgi:hypothetical protein
MAKSGFKKSKEWVLFRKRIDPSLLLKKRGLNIIDAAMIRACQLIILSVKKNIRKGGFTKNAALTLALKTPQKRPLAGISEGGFLLPSITYEKVGEGQYFVGIKMTDKNFNIAAAIHEGANIKVTDKMRNMFTMLFWASNSPTWASKLTGRAEELFELKPGGWKRLKRSTKFIRIPARPFMLQVFLDAGLRSQVENLWSQAITKAMRWSK